MHVQPPSAQARQKAAELERIKKEEEERKAKVEKKTLTRLVRLVD